MRVFSLPPERERVTDQEQWRLDQSRRWLLELDAYEIVNLRRLLDAVAGRTGEEGVPVTAFNNGDWVGQIGFYLPETPGANPPNRPYPETTP